MPIVTAERPLELVSCPECGQVASIEWSSTIRGVVHLKIRCIARHWFLMPGEQLDNYGRVDRYQGRTPAIGA